MKRELHVKIAKNAITSIEKNPWVTPVSNQRHRFGLAIIGRAIRASGVHGVTLKGDEIEVTGERVDSVILALLLKKSFRHAELVSVGPVEEKKKENKEEPTMQPLVWPCTSFPQYPICEMRTINLDLVEVDSIQGTNEVYLDLIFLTSQPRSSRSRVRVLQDEDFSDVGEVFGGHEIDVVGDEEGIDDENGGVVG
ncbi:hypothetical protein JHK84_035390 [Glycine max]|nr:hypothetical protein JHK84_035390 [Glycine max]